MNRKQVFFALIVIFSIFGLLWYVKASDKSSSDFIERQTNSESTNRDTGDTHQPDDKLAVQSLELIPASPTVNKYRIRVNLNAPTSADTVVSLRSKNDAALTVPDHCVVKAKQSQCLFYVTARSADSVVGAHVETVVNDNRKIVSVILPDEPVSSIEPRSVSQSRQDVLTTPILVSLVVSFGSLLVASVSLFMMMKLNRRAGRETSGSENLVLPVASEVRNREFEKVSNQQHISYLNDEIHKFRNEFIQANATNALKLNEVISLYSSKLESLSHQVIRLQQEKTDVLLTSPPHYVSSEVSPDSAVVVPSTKFTEQEQDILAKLDADLNHSIVYPGAIKTLSYYWDHFSPHLKSAFLVKLQATPFNVIEPQYGDTFDPSTMEYVSLPAQCRKMVTEVVELGFVDMKTSEIYPAKVVII